MKLKKHINSILILLVLFIWGAIGFKYFYKKETTQKSNESIPSMTVANYNIQKDTFQLKDIQNPFSRTMVSVKKTMSKKTHSTQKKYKKKAIPIKIQWPKVSYHGYVMKNGSSKKLGILKVNGKVMKKRKNELLEDTFTIKNIYEDSIEITHKKTSKIIKKQ